ncbi:hypothetical protein HYX06_01210 [Candidatus Woesearchaeota archaeon]|nr:hypothetical protein [Candidatus Woesearchaeota archaeon]
MGLLNHLFGNRTDLAREINFDAQKRLSLWSEHLANYPKREALAKFFSYANVDNALNNLAKLDDVLAEIGSLVSNDLVSIGDEEKTQDEILQDIERIITSRGGYAVSHLTSIVARQAAIFNILKKLYQLLKVELHAIRAARKNPNRTFLLNLFKLIFHEEASINNMFMEECYSKYGKATWEDLDRLIKATILEEKLTEDMQSAEETFVRMAVKEIGSGTRRNYRRLAEDVYYDLLEIIGTPFRTPEDFDRGLKELERLVLDDNTLRKLILKNKRKLKLTDEQVEWMIKAFRKSYESGHFEELDAEFGT